MEATCKPARALASGRQRLGEVASAQARIPPTPPSMPMLAPSFSSLPGIVLVAVDNLIPDASTSVADRDVRPPCCDRPRSRGAGLAR